MGKKIKKSKILPKEKLYETTTLLIKILFFIKGKK
jgi:hypothetical protein